MRVFIAVELPQKWQEELWLAGQALGRLVVRGRFTRQENFHLTLAFLGEVPDPSGAAAVLDRLEAAPFPLKTAEANRFVLRGGDIWWVGVAPHPALLEAQAKLCAGLGQSGFALDRRPFLPHITLARRVHAPKQVGPEALTGLLPPMETRVRQLTLMSSQLTPGGPVYTPIYRAPLG